MSDWMQSEPAKLVKAAIQEPSRVQVAQPRHEPVQAGDKFVFVRQMPAGWFGVLVIQRPEFAEAIEWREFSEERRLVQWCDDMLGTNATEYVSRSMQN